MLRSVDGLALRQLRTRPLRSALTALGVVLGVGMVFGVLLLVGTIRQTMDDAFGSALGHVDLVVTSEAGTMPEAALQDVLAVPGVRDAGGMIGAAVPRVDAEGRPLSGMAGRVMVAGYDRDHVAPYDFKVVEGRPLRAGVEVVVERNWARDRGYAVGDRLRVAMPSGPAELPIAGLFEFSGGFSLGGLGLAAMPLDAARQLMEQPSGWFQISVAAEDRGAADALARDIAAVLPRGAEVKTPEGLSDAMQAQLEAFNVVLYFFSGIALFVGGFLILNSFNMTVLQRTRELGMLRTLGATRRAVMRTVLLEAAAIGAVGSVLGLGLGIALASGLIALMRGLGMPVGSVHVAAGPAITAVVLGLVVTAFAALWPARRAGRMSPMRAVMGLGATRRRPTLRRAAVGLALFGPGALLGGSYWFGGASESGGAAAGLGIAMTMAMFAGMAVLAPFVIVPVVRALGVPFRAIAPAGGRLAVDALVANPGRTAATAAALMIGLSVVVVNASMATSMSRAVTGQIERSFARDFNVQAAGYTLVEGGGPGVPAALRTQIDAMPETRVATPVRAVVTDLPRMPDAQPGLVMGIDPAVFGLMDTTPVRGASREAALRAVANGAVLIDANYAAASGLERGDALTLAGSSGTRRTRVAGVLDAMAEFAPATMQVSHSTMQAVYGHAPDAQLAVKARDEAAQPVLERRITELLARDHPHLELQSSADAQQQVRDQIDAQFNLFHAIVAVAVVVSLLGVVNALAMSVLERTREIGVLRALGASRWKVRRTMLDEALMLTLAGSLTGIAFGLVVAAWWSRSFDETVPGASFAVPAGAIAIVAAAAVVLGGLAAVLPARRAARLNVLGALKYE